MHNVLCVKLHAVPVRPLCVVGVLLEEGWLYAERSHSPDVGERIHSNL